MTSLYALSHGIKDVNPANHLYGVSRFPEGLQTRFYFWCIKDGKEGTILVDQGCTDACLEAMNIPPCLTGHPLDLLNSIGVEAKDVKYVILSHLHWDHFAGDLFFPNAKYYIHQREVEFVSGPEMRFKVYSRHYYPGAVNRIKELSGCGKLRILNGEVEEILPGITAMRTGGHTPGLLSIAVRDNAGVEKIICGDVAPRYMNLEENIPCGIHYNVTEALDALEKINSRAGQSPDNVLPGHDPAVAEKYVEIAPGAYKIF